MSYDPVKVIGWSAAVIVSGACWFGVWKAVEAIAAPEPPATHAAIRSVYPDLWKRELGREHVSWAHLRRMVGARWRSTHRCARATLEHVARFRGYWPAVERTWACDGLAAWKRDFLRCIPRYEGGYQYPDTVFGGGRGYAALHGNVVLGPWQVRPGWIRGAMEGRPGTYAGDYWTRSLYDYAVRPVNMARVVEFIAPGAYATAGFCS